MTERVAIREGLFSEAEAGGVLLGSKCSACGQVFFPKVQFCLSCFEEKLEEVKLSRRGKLYSYTIGYMPTAHFQPPYGLGYVDLREGVRVFAPLKMVEGQPFTIGMDVELEIEGLWQEDGREVVGYRFAPV